ncbi:MAG: ATP-binding cassette domain-containing protein [Gammaproteobacteria bacterium]|nr:ATP-binding cassette domain-containing protein [Gammaproteobacteria bacterium]MCW5583245.1 ATP-binding cassette domain-containing protein [Gammaproteobacteria bacterium]
MKVNDPIIKIKNLKTFLGSSWIHKGLNLTINRGEVLGIVGGSGSGKTTLLREILNLTRPTSGSITLFGHELLTASSQALLEIQQRWGVLFQSNALFSSLTLLENVMFPLKEHTSLDPVSMKDLALLKIRMAGLSMDSALKYPAELSGGMQKRAGLARAIVLDPELIFLDEPTAGLDPNTAAGLDELILNLQSTMGLTIVMITHDLDSLWRVTDRVAFLGEGVVLCVDDMSVLVKNPNPLIQDFFGGPRGRAAQESYQHEK